MANYRVKVRTYCMGRVYEVGDYCDEKVAAALGPDAELVSEGAESTGEAEAKPVRATKPAKKVSVKGLKAEDTGDNS